MLLAMSGKAAEARVEHQKALALFRKLAEDNPSVPDYRDHAANTDNFLSAVMRQLSRPAEARDHAERALAIREQLVTTHPESANYRAGLAENLLSRGLARRALGDHAGAVSDLRQAVALFDAQTSPSGEICFESACAHSALAGLAGQAGSGVLAADRPSEADRAMALLRQAVAMGYSNPEQYRTDDALNPLRNRNDFRQLLMDLAMPSEGFAPAR
jgi:tetratricopeptide (TPR) repeat protein